MTEKEVWEYEEKACPGCGSCSGMFTANSMNCLTEVLEWVFRATERSCGLCGKNTPCKESRNEDSGIG